MSASRGRLIFAVVLAGALAVAAAVVALSGSSANEGTADECISAWNADAIARSDGAHAHQDHGYRATQVTRVDPVGNAVPEDQIEGPPTKTQRCAVIFASTNVEFEFDFGVRVLDSARWAGLAAVDGLPAERILAFQADASGATNATLLPDGRLAD